MDGPIKRIQGARELWRTGDKENAAILIFVATAGISRIRYPSDTYKDWEAFTKFIRDEIATITNGAAPKPLTFPTKNWKLPVVMNLFGVKERKGATLEQIIYGVWRCMTIHEARWPDEVYLTETQTDTEYCQTIEILPDGKMGLPEVWILGLADAVEYAVEIMLPKILLFPMYILYSAPVMALGSNNFQWKPGETKIAQIKIRNQQAVPIFTAEEDMKTYTEQNPDVSVGVLPNIDSLRNFVEHGGDAARFIFNPRVGDKPLPSYTQASVLATIRRFM